MLLRYDPCYLVKGTELAPKGRVYFRICHSFVENRLGK